MMQSKPLAVRTSSTLFAQEWIKAPLRVGAVAPSSSALVRAMTQGISADAGPVIELGPGTGIFTQALLERGVPGQKISAIETSEGFAERLARCFPDVLVIVGDAARVRHLSPYDPQSVATVICGLPLLSMSASKVHRIVAGSFAVLKPGGKLRLFTYGAKCPVSQASLNRLGLAGHRACFVALNVPPASVYDLYRRDL